MRSLIDGLISHAKAIKSGLTLPTFTSNQLIHLYSKHGLVREARKLFDEMPQRNVFSWNAIISAYIKSHDLVQAKALFDSASIKDSVTYNSMLSGYVNAEGYESGASELFLEMQAAGNGIKFDEFSLTTMLNWTAKVGVALYGRMLHSCMVKTGNCISGFAVSSLVDMYSKCGCFAEASLVFDECGGVVDRVSKNAMVAACCREGEMEMALDVFKRDMELNDAVSWNTLISGYVQNGYEGKALEMFVCMGETGVRRNEHTFASVLNACASLKSLKVGKEVHAWVLKNGMTSNPFVNSGIVDVYCKSGNLKYAEAFYTTSVDRVRNPFSDTSMIVGYSAQGNMAGARKLFDFLEHKNSVVWTALFSGYVRSQQCEAVFDLFNEFRAKEPVVPDTLILVNLLGACALQAALDPGRQIHAYILRAGIEMDKILTSALVDMYAKGGNVNYAKKFFQKTRERDQVLYNIMIGGYSYHGHGKEAFCLFEEMLEKDVRPDAVTFIALLSACRHCGLVEKGEKYFHSMMDEYGILPENDHYACMIDLYGRAGQLGKAVAFMRRIPVEADAIILGSFLNACRINGNTALAKEAEDKLLKIEDNGSRYVQLANVYAAEGNWTEMKRIREQMRGKEFKKHAGCSWVYVENKVHIFTSGDSSHSKTEAIYSILDCLSADFYGIV